MLKRRVNPYFVTAKWNFAPAARRKALAAHTLLEHAKTHIWNTHDRTDTWGDDPAVQDAFDLLERAAEALVVWEAEQHQAARERDAR